MALSAGAHCFLLGVHQQTGVTPHWEAACAGHWDSACAGHWDSEDGGNDATAKWNENTII